MLQAWSGGDASALERLTPIVYAELQRIARRHLAAEPEGHLLQPSALVNEAFVRLIGEAPVAWANRSHFFGLSARLMRQILIDVARKEVAAKRGGRSPHVELAEAEGVPADLPSATDLIDLDNALNELAALDPRQCQLVEMRYFAGMGNAEIARVLGVSEPTVVRDWRAARAWLYDRLQTAREGRSMRSGEDDARQ